ncbi:MAG: GNAT family N-acetyltransferase [Saprospiraceae bacterium]|nr:GNAT family N-acetyltransferase [Saprospiraceae bacterium]
MNFSIQPLLQNKIAIIQPLQESDFERLFAVACDPLIWEQHPNKNRYKRDVFETFFKGAIESEGAFLIVDNVTNEVAGCTRFYDYNQDKNLILIGYTFYAKKFWGSGMNNLVKTSMLDYIFTYLNTVHFHIGATNFRSQVAIGRFNAIKILELNVAYYGEPEAVNFVYEIKKENWIAFRAGLKDHR